MTKRLLAAAAVLTGLALPAHAWEITPPPSVPSGSTYDPPAQVPQYGDDRGGAVDATTGFVGGGGVLVSIGDLSDGGLGYARDITDPIGRRDNFLNGIEVDGNRVVVTALGTPYRFEKAGSTYNALYGTGATLTKSGATWTLIGRHGTVYTFDEGLAADVPVYAPGGRLTRVVAPDGTQLDLAYLERSLCKTSSNCTDKLRSARLTSVVSSRGYQVKYWYQTTRGNNTFDSSRQHHKVTRVSTINTTVDVCNATTNSCGVSSTTWPTVRFSYGTSNGGDVVTMTNALNQQTRYTYDSASRLIGVRFPSSGGGADDVTYQYHSSGRAKKVTRGGWGWSYKYAVSGATLTTTISDPYGKKWKVRSRTEDGLVENEENPYGAATSYTYHSNGLLKTVTGSEGISVTYNYDGRGNVSSVRRKAKSGSGLTDLLTTIGYQSSCTTSNRKYCNKPAWMQDWRGRTNYLYHASSGFLRRSELPDAGQGRLRTDYGYKQVQARYKSTSGDEVLRPTWRLGYVSVIGGARSDYHYQYEGSVGSPTNNFPKRTVTSGSDIDTATTWFSYDQIGNLKAVNNPIGGKSDKIATSYDALRRPVVQVGTAPSGANGVLLRRVATRTTYDVDGQVQRTERGHVASRTDFDSFVALDRQENRYDAHGRLSRQWLYAGGTHAAVDYSYDRKSRVVCTAYRMTALTSTRDACAASSGGFGYDRVVKRTYDDADRVTYVTTGYGTADAIIEATRYYMSGRVKSVSDGKGNTTSYHYDGYGRLERTDYPAGGDDRYAYHATKDLLMKHTRRDGQAINYRHDTLGRVTKLDAPGTAQDVSTVYDRLGRPTSMTGGGRTLSYGYDRLGRVLSAGGPQGTVTYRYDAAGRREWMGYPGAGNVSVAYKYDGGGAVTEIREQTTSGPLLARYEYDQLGRRAKLVRGNGIETRYQFDQASRLDWLSFHVNNHTAYSRTVRFDHNPAGQVTRREDNNSGYAPLARNDYQFHKVGSLNQLTQINLNATGSGGWRTVRHDARWNLTNDGTGRSYGYDVLNRLTSASVPRSGGGTQSVTLSYDPAGRIHEEYAVGISRLRFLYDGSDLIAETSTSGTVQRRYVHGPGTDEPLVWYEGSGTSNKRYFVADEQGTVVLVTASTGGVIRHNRYSEDGLATTSHYGRFGYTGQTRITGTELWHYKARAYDPRLGRFLQTDPIGYGDGLNAFAYVGGDPVNKTDPSGMVARVVGGTCDSGGCTGYGTFTPLSWGYSGGVHNSGLSSSATSPASQGLTSEGGTTSSTDGSCSTSAEKKAFQAAMPAAASAQTSARISLGALLRGLPPLAIHFALRPGVDNRPRTTIYRAVSNSELDSIFSTTPASFSTAGNSLGDKQFFLTLSGAQTFAGIPIMGADAIVSTNVRQSTLQQGTPLNLPSVEGGAAISFPPQSLPSLNRDAAETGIQVVEDCSES